MAVVPCHSAIFDGVYSMCDGWYPDITNFVGNGHGHVLLKFNASGANPIYGMSATVTPKSRECKYFIKY